MKWGKIYDFSQIYKFPKGRSSKCLAAKTKERQKKSERYIDKQMDHLYNNME